MSTHVVGEEEFLTRALTFFPIRIPRISHPAGWKEAHSPEDRFCVPTAREISVPWKIGPSALRQNGQPRAEFP